MTLQALKSAPRSMQAELETLIDALSLEALPKIFLKSRWLDQLLWLEAASLKNQRLYYIFRLACIIGGVILPALVSLNAGGRLGGFLQFVTVVLSLVVAMSAAVEEFFHFGERWRHYRRSAEFIKGEGWTFFQLTGYYHGYADHAEAYPTFAGRMEEAMQKELEIFITKISKEDDRQRKKSTT